MSATIQLPAVSLVATPTKRRAIIDLAVEIERRGFAGIACPSLGATMSLCTSLAHATSSISFWTSIQPIYYNHPFELGNTAAHIHEISGGRFALGLGVSHESMVKRLGVPMGPPLSDMREFVSALRANEKYSGELPPLYVAALRNRMLDLAREIGDGALWANASLRHTREQRNRVTDPAFYLANMIPTVISDDRSAAAAINRRTMSVYVRLPNYRNYWKAAGYVEEMEAVEALLAEGRRDDVTRAMSDRWLADCTLFGTADEVRDGFAAWRSIGVEPIAVMSSTSGGQVKAIGELFDVYS